MATTKRSRPDPHSAAIESAEDDVATPPPVEVDLGPLVDGLPEFVPVSTDAQPTIAEMAEQQGIPISRIPRVPVASPTAPPTAPPIPDTHPSGSTFDALAGSETARALAAMQQEIARLTSEVGRLRTAGQAAQDSKEAGPSGYPWQYYKRPDTGPGAGPHGEAAGWVMLAPGGAAPKSGRRDVGAYVHYTGGKGFLPLTSYGVAPVPLGYGPSGNDFIPMLERGGAVEFPLSQVLTYRWHIRPPVAGLKFPAYEAHKDQARHFVCEDCEVELWFADTDTITVRAALRHLLRPNRDGSHGYKREEAHKILTDQGITPPGGRMTVAVQGELGEAAK